MAAPKAPLWIALLCSVALFALGAVGILAKLGGRLPLNEGVVMLALLGLACLPLGLAFLALERERPAPALRHWAAPVLLCSLSYTAVQITGGPSSALYAVYALLGVYLGRHQVWWLGLGLTALLTLLEALPLATVVGDGASHWPLAAALAWPLGGLLLGWLTLGRGSTPPPAPPLKGRGTLEMTGAAGSAEAAPLLALDVERLDAAQLLAKEIEESLEMAAASHPGWNALALWWGDVEGMELRGLRVRLGVGAALGTPLPKGEGLLGLALREKRLLSVEPLAASAAKGLPYYADGSPARVLRALPLSDEGRLIGLLVCDKADEAPFSADEAKALDALGKLLVTQAQRASFLSNLQVAGERTGRLYEATKQLAGSLNREELLERFGQLLGSVIAQDGFALAWHEEEGAPLRRLASAGYASNAALDLALEQNAALAGVLQNADAAIIFNGESSAIPAALNEGLAKAAQHFLLVPLRLGGRLAGVLKLDRRLAPFEEHERESALIFGNQAAITIENARLYSLYLRQATTDGLTGLYNHRFFQERLATELANAERTGKPLSLGLTDIDHFKKFNDTFGHQEGDVVLKKVAHLMKDQVRQGKDIVCRYGGEEFVVIMPDCDIVEARQVLDGMRAYCGANLVGGTGPEARAITMSIGLCSFPQGAREQRDLIHVADEALYKAKKGGRNQVCSYKDLP